MSPALYFCQAAQVIPNSYITHAEPNLHMPTMRTRLGIAHGLLMPRYLIHSILCHCVQIQSNYAKLLVCLWKYRTLRGLYCHINPHVHMEKCEGQQMKIQWK